MVVTAEQRQQIESNPPPTAQAVRARAMEYMARAGMGDAELAHETGYARSSLRLFLAGRYGLVSERDDYIRATLATWMDAHPVPEPGGEDVPEKLIPSYDTKLILERCEDARRNAQAVALEGPPGTSKTVTLSWYAAERNQQRKRDGVYFRAFEGITGTALLKRIAQALGVPSQRTRERVLASVIRRLRERRPCVLLVDEAQRLVSHGIEPFETLRDLVDEAKCGAVLAGHFNFLKALSNGLGCDLEQWLSRIDVREHLRGLQADDLARVAREYFGEGIDAATVKTIAEHAEAPDRNATLRARLFGRAADRKNGGLRYLNFRRVRKLFEQTQRLRALPGNDRASLSALIRAAAGQMMRAL